MKETNRYRDWTDQEIRSTYEHLREVMHERGLHENTPEVYVQMTVTERRRNSISLGWGFSCGSV